MKTTLIFVRHARPNYNNHDDLTRELNDKGLNDRWLVTKYLETQNVDVLISSPYKRAVDTIKHFADKNGLPVLCVDGFRERKIDSVWIEDFASFCEKQWEDFNYKLTDGESLREVQTRNISALNEVLEKYQGKTVVVGSHGTALSAIINYYDKSFGHQDFLKIQKLMPWVVKFEFYGFECGEIEKINLFKNSKSDLIF